MRRLLAIIPLALLAACACTQAGCNSQVAFATPQLDLDVAYDVEACIDGQCQRALLGANGPVDPQGSSDHGLIMHDTAHVIELRLGQADLSGGHAVTLTIRDAAGAIVHIIHEEIQFTRIEPNGALCVPTCWQAEVEA